MEVGGGGGEEDDCPEQWADAGWKELETLEQACRCTICGEFFDTPVSVAECGHTFCSLCLRRNLEYQQRSNRALDNSATCPQCRGPASTKTMRLQINLRCVVDSFVKVRGRLLHQLKHKHETATTTTTTPEPLRETNKRKQRERRRQRGEEYQTEVEEEEKKEQEQVKIGGRRGTRRTRRYSHSKDFEFDSDREDQNLRASPTCSDYEMENSFQTGAGDFEDEVQLVEREEGEMPKQTASTPPPPPPVTNSAKERVIPKGRAQCPICGILVSEALISGHVDVCLEKQERRSSRGVSLGFGTMSATTTTMRTPLFCSPLGGKLPNKLEPKKLPKLVYHIIKDKELRKYAQRYSLPAAGDRKTLVNRLKEFTHRYNASIDSGNPTTYKRVASAVMGEERCKTMAAQTSAVRNSNKADQDKQDDDRFAEMIEQVKRRKLEMPSEADNDAKENASPPRADVDVNVVVKVPETLTMVVPETVNLIDSSQEIEDSEDDFVIPSQMHPKARASMRRRRSSRISSQN